MTDIYEQAAEALARATPGPWNVTDDIPPRPVEVAGCLLAHFSRDPRNPPHMDANARLIALAPAMAEELARVKKKLEAAERAIAERDARIRAEERERCARVVEHLPNGTHIGDIATAIRGDDNAP